MPKPKDDAAGADTAKRHPLNMRTTKRVRDLLEQAANRSGRSLAQEVEYRLEQSFDTEAVASKMLAAAWGQRTAAIALLVGRMLNSADVAARLQGLSGWLTDPDVFEITKNRIDDLLVSLRPTREDDLEGMVESLKASFQSLARMTAIQMMALTDSGPNDPLVELLDQELKERLSRGPAVQPTTSGQEQ